MDRKIVMLLIGIVAIGMFALPSTLAMYTGQHNFTNGSQVDCDKCHGTGDSIGDELAAGSAHNNFTCKQCHGFLTTNPNTNGTMGHAATANISCTGCHAEEANYLTDVLDSDNITVTDELTAGAHTNFQECIACHTQVGVSSNVVAAANNSTFDLSGYTYANGGV